MIIHSNEFSMDKMAKPYTHSMRGNRGTSRIKPICRIGKLLIGSYWILLALVARAFSSRNNLAHRLYVTGHSMGGAGALLAATSHRAFDKHRY